nr:metalloregulator ArsR/SmtB family transcription factor [Microbacterium bovistercoris]
MSPDATDEVFRILADPTRRRILDLLAAQGEQSVGALAAAFPGLVASGISKHLMALRAAGLVRARKEGRNQLYRLDPDALHAAMAPWLRRYEVFWTDALLRLRDVVEEPPAGGRSDTREPPE